jgi:GNAT superfamily N-acetyltransferase
MTTTYRVATAQDVPAVKDLTDVMLAHTGLGVATPEKLHSLITNPAGVWILAEQDGKAIGFVSGIIHETMFNNERRVSDMGWFVLPEYRGGFTARRLMTLLEQWAKLQGIKQIWFGQTTGDDIESVVKYYKRSGYTIKGFNAVKEL